MRANDHLLGSVAEPGADAEETSSLHRGFAATRGPAIEMVGGGNCMNMPLRKTFALVALLAFGPGCNCNLLFDPESRASALPQSANVAVGATHDVLVIACQDKVTLKNFVFPVVATALFVGLGRLDAAFYLPGALVKAAIPQCETVDYSVTAEPLEGTAFELETTPNPNAFKLHARSEGESIFRAQVNAGGERIEVKSTFRALKANRVTFVPVCQSAPAGTTVLPGHVPAGGTAAFSHQLFNGTTALSGYGGAHAVSHPRLTLKDGSRVVMATVSAERGPFTVTSPIDPAFSLALTAYDATDFDPPVVERVTTDTIFVDQTALVRTRATIGGQVPCEQPFTRTVTIETPTVCRINDRTDTFSVPSSGNGDLLIKALATGTCRVAMTSAGSPARASVEFPVFRGFEPLAALPGTVVQPGISISDFWLVSVNEQFLVGTETDISGRGQSVTLRRVGGAWTLRQSLTPRASTARCSRSAMRARAPPGTERRGPRSTPALPKICSTSG